MRDSRRRSMAKALSWRAVATVTTGVLVFAFTGRLDIALTVGLAEVAVKTVLYFGHERAWDRLQYGRGGKS